MKSVVWRWYRGYYKLYLEDSGLKRRICNLKHCKEHCLYFHADGKRGWDIIFSAKVACKIQELTGIIFIVKNKNRVRVGKKLGMQAKLENRLGIKKTSNFSIVKFDTCPYNV